MLRLNKFNVIPFHSLTITRHFESQQAPLSFEDWEATHRAMKVFHTSAKQASFEATLEGVLLKQKKVGPTSVWMMKWHDLLLSSTLLLML